MEPTSTSAPEGSAGCASEGDATTAPPVGKAHATLPSAPHSAHSVPFSLPKNTSSRPAPSSHTAGEEDTAPPAGKAHSGASEGSASLCRRFVCSAPTYAAAGAPPGGGRSAMAGEDASPAPRRAELCGVPSAASNCHSVPLRSPASTLHVAPLRHSAGVLKK